MNRSTRPYKWGFREVPNYDAFECVICNRRISALVYYHSSGRNCFKRHQKRRHNGKFDRGLRKVIQAESERLYATY